LRTKEKTVDQPLSRTPTYPEQLSQIKQGIRTLAVSQPQTIQAFTALHRATMTSGALAPKTKELMALAIGIATHCDGCIAFHTQDALKAGATEAEITETLAVAVLMGGGPALMYATHALEAMQQFHETDTGPSS
jgi:AhpD family alkylhydroperoxidase